MKPLKTIITDFHFDVNDMFEAWDEGKIDDKLAIEKLISLSIHLLRDTLEYVLEKVK